MGTPTATGVADGADYDVYLTGHSPLGYGGYINPRGMKEPFQRVKVLPGKVTGAPPDEPVEFVYDRPVRLAVRWDLGGQPGHLAPEQGWGLLVWMRSAHPSIADAPFLAKADLNPNLSWKRHWLLFPLAEPYTVSPTVCFNDVNHVDPQTFVADDPDVAEQDLGVKLLPVRVTVVERDDAGVERPLPGALVRWRGDCEGAKYLRDLGRTDATGTLKTGMHHGRIEFLVDGHAVLERRWRGPTDATFQPLSHGRRHHVTLATWPQVSELRVVVDDDPPGPDGGGGGGDGYYGRVPDDLLDPAARGRRVA